MACDLGALPVVNGGRSGLLQKRHPWDYRHLGSVFRKPKFGIGGSTRSVNPDPLQNSTNSKKGSELLLRAGLVTKH
eukprot:1621648-Amphidinium_carterae.1